MIKDLECDPEDFFITTFTRNAASELKDRLEEYLTEKEVNQMTIGTFHSIAYKNVNKTNKSDKLINFKLYGSFVFLNGQLFSAYHLIYKVLSPINTIIN